MKPSSKSVNSRHAAPDLEPRVSGGGTVQPIGPDAWRLAVPPGPAGPYRWAQLGDYLPLPRARFLWHPPFRLALRARVSAPGLPGTWGFGLWNDPFSMSFGVGGAARRIPSLPNCAWFFHASPPNYLSLRDDLPAQGLFAGTFRSPRVPGPLLALAAPGALVLALPALARPLRRLARLFVRQDAARLDLDPTAWHSFTLDWQAGRALFMVDGQPVLDTPISPNGPLGLVLWIDNQYAAFGPDGRLRFGTLPGTAEGWLEIEFIGEVDQEMGDPEAGK